MRTSALLFTLTISCLLTGSISAMDAAEPPRPGPNLDREAYGRFYSQASAAKGAKLIHDAVHRFKPKGFASLALEDSGQGIVLGWKGAIPPKIQTAINNALLHAHVRIENAPYSHDELTRAADILADHIKSMDARTSPFHGVLVHESGRLQVLEDPSRTIQSAHNFSLPPVGVPVELVGLAPGQFATRLNDSPPWYGGARIRSERGGVYRSMCTSGFAVTNGYTEYLLTAAHCATAPDTVRDYTGQYIGLVSREDWKKDILLVATDVRGRIYDGGVGVNEFTKPVFGWDWVSTGEWLCHSGSVSGVVCNLNATNISAATLRLCDSDGDCYYVDDLMVARRMDGRRAVQGGDSGGPVFVPLSNGYVTAKGTITGYFGVDYMAFQDFGTTRYLFNVWPASPWQ